MQNRYLLPAVLSFFFILTAIFLAFHLTAPSPSSEPAYFVFVFNVIFLVMIGLVVSLFSARSYLSTGQLNLLILGSAVLLLVFASFIAGLGLWITVSANVFVTIHNCLVLIAGALFFLGSFMSFQGLTAGGSSNLKLKLLAGYLAVVVLSLSTFYFALNEFTPVFFIVGTGSTALRNWVLACTVLLFSLSSILLGIVYRKSKSKLLYWYSGALALLAVGFFIIIFVKYNSGPLVWTGRAAQYAGSVFFLFAALNSARPSSNSWAEAFSGNRNQIETLFSKMLNGFSYHRVIVDKEGKPVDYVFLAANEAFEKMTGLKRENVVGKRVTEVLPGIEKDPADWIGVYGKVALTGQPVIIESYSELLRKWYAVSAYSPRPSYFAAIFEDITERKKAEDKLEEYTKNLEVLAEERTRKLESSALYARSLIEASLDPLITISADGKITDVNKATEQATGCSREELIGSDFSDYFTEPEKAAAGYKQVFTEGFVMDYPLAIRHKSGKVTEVLYNASVYLNAGGQVQGVFAAARDITERKKLEKKLQESERLATIGSTAGMVGHDIRNPLQAIAGDVYLAKSDLASLPDGEAKEAVQESLVGIEKNVNYINKIVQDLQDFARSLNPVIKEIDLRSLCEEVLLKTDIPKTIKSSCKVNSDARQVKADPDLLRRVLGNLVTNSVQAMPEGGKLLIRASRVKKDVLIEVQDTGVGISEDMKPKLFTPLFTTKSKGQGFGLAVVKRVTEAMNGTVTFESKHGEGTTFAIRLPLPDDNR